MILSYAVWRDDFGGRADILGAKAIIDGQPANVVGVMSADFDFPRGARIWKPLALNVAREMSRERVSLLRVIGRLRPGVDYARASSDLGMIHERIAEQFPEIYGQIRVRLTPLSRQLVSDAHSPLLLLSGAVLLLIACANLAALLLARGAVRRLAQVDPGLDPQNVLTMSVKLLASHYPEQSARQSYLDRLLRELRALPGVEAVAASNSLPLQGSPLTGPVEVEGPSPGRFWRAANRRLVRSHSRLFPGHGNGIAGRPGPAPVGPKRCPSVAVVNQRFAACF